MSDVNELDTEAEAIRQFYTLPGFVEEYVLNAVDRDAEADMEWNGNSIKIREKHRLY